MQPFQLVLLMLGLLAVLRALYKSGIIDGLARFIERELRNHFETERDMRRWKLGPRPRALVSFCKRRAR